MDFTDVSFGKSDIKFIRSVYMFVGTEAFLTLLTPFILYPHARSVSEYITAFGSVKSLHTML